jgi:hypothetical protein
MCSLCYKPKKSVHELLAPNISAIIYECLLDAIMAKVDVIVAIQPTFCLTPYVVFYKPR